MAVQAITGHHRCVSVSVCDGLDTHFDDWATDQGPRKHEAEVISKMIQELNSKQSTWLDHTVIVGFSEFSRTALLNVRGGRDHSLTNAAFITGAKIRGGQVIGRSSDVGMQPTTTNLYTGMPDPEGVIRPEHILQTLFDEVGIGEAPDLVFRNAEATY